VETTGRTRYGKRFDWKYGYNGSDLGAICTGARTVFKVWSPEADRVELSLYRDDASPAWRILPMRRRDRGVWSVIVEGDLHGIYYDYTVERDGKAVHTADPYAHACGRNGVRSMAVDLPRTNPEGWWRDAAPPAQAEHIIYELHVKDFSHHPASGVPAEYRGKFKAFSYRDGDGRLPLCMSHLKNLGVTHVQLLPIADFATVDEDGGGSQYSWGYDPMNLNVPEGSYATDPADGAVRIRECKEMIQALHQNGLRVIMDVVYNHTFYADSWLERTAPGYYYRRRPNGALSNGSGCGNDVAAGRIMVDNYIANSVLYWAREYHVDGFRFDLMGLMTVELMNRIRRELDLVFGPGEKLLYGEPWRAGDSPMEADTHPAVKACLPLFHPGIAVFCDNTRDAVKGSCFDARAPGFVSGGEGLEHDILQAAAGWPDGAWEFSPRDPSQLIVYLSCHDNFTLWDKLALCASAGEGIPGPDAFRPCRDNLLAQNRLAAFICFTCPGIPFLQAGEEFGRTKLGDCNSYRSPPEVNRLDWDRAWRFGWLTDYYRGLIRLRKALPGLRDKSRDVSRRITDHAVPAPHVVSFQVDQGGPEGEPLLIVCNASALDYSLPLPPGRWIVRADGQWADQHRPAGQDGEHITVPPCSGMLLLRLRDGHLE
jgi:type I pullulanase